MIIQSIGCSGITNNNTINFQITTDEVPSNTLVYVSEYNGNTALTTWTNAGPLNFTTQNLSYTLTNNNTTNIKVKLCQNISNQQLNTTIIDAYLEDPDMCSPTSGTVSWQNSAGQNFIRLDYSSTCGIEKNNIYEPVLEMDVISGVFIDGNSVPYSGWVNAANAWTYNLQSGTMFGYYEQDFNPGDTIAFRTAIVYHPMQIRSPWFTLNLLMVPSG